MADSRIHEETKERGVEDEKIECDVVMIHQKENKEENKHSLMEELHRSHSSSSSSSDEEEEGGEKERKTKKKKKGSKETVEENREENNVDVPVQSCQETHVQAEEKKGFLKKIKEKLSGHQKETKECAAEPEGETKEKKGILEKIKEKLPRGQKNGEVEVKDKDN